MLSRQRLLALALAAPFALTPTAARANGKFPSADFLVAAPNDPATLLARTTFGLLLSKDQGSHWSWVCEGAALFKNYEPAVALTGSGHMVLAYIDGVGAAGPALCDYAKKPGGFEGVFVVDVSIDPDTPSTVYGVSAQGGINVTKVYRSDDDGESWVQAGVDLPKNFLGKTLELPNGAEPRIYVSGQDTSTGAVLGRIARSVDDGQSWELFDVPGSGIGTAPFLGAVDPTDPDRLYVRLDGAPGQLLVSQDAGESWTHDLHGDRLFEGFCALARRPDRARRRRPRRHPPGEHHGLRVREDLRGGSTLPALGGRGALRVRRRDPRRLHARRLAGRRRQLHVAAASALPGGPARLRRGDQRGRDLPRRVARDGDADRREPRGLRGVRRGRRRARRRGRREHDERGRWR
jgi:photosystem II stability/assembly factor-like uncharacterized protein